VSSRTGPVAHGASPMSLLFLDIDDVLCTNVAYGGRHAALALRSQNSSGVHAFPWRELFLGEACAALNLLMERHQPRVVVTSTWMMLFNKAAMVEVFNLTGLERVAVALHPHWDAPQNRFETRLSAVERWLKANHEGEPFAVLDDIESGTGLANSTLERDGRVVLCEPGKGLHAGLLPALEAALRKPGGRSFRG